MSALQRLPYPLHRRIPARIDMRFWASGENLAFLSYDAGSKDGML